MNTVSLIYKFTNSNGASVTSQVNTSGTLTLETLTKGISINLGSHDIFEISFEVTAADKLPSHEITNFFNLASASNVFEEVEDDFGLPTVESVPELPDPELPETGISKNYTLEVSVALILLGTCLVIIKSLKKSE